MALTYAQVKTELAPFARNGMCPTDAALIVEVNKAQRMLHAAGEWLGCMARYTVNVVGGTVTIPSALESAIRITSYTGTGATNGGTLQTDDAYAFTHDSDSMVELRFTPTLPRVFTLNVSPMPSAVSVFGKKAYVAVTGDASELIVSDIDALRLMLLSNWRMENNQLELGEKLKQEALLHLTNKTVSAVENARRMNYQALLSSAIEGSLDYTRAKIALDVEGGTKVNDAILVDYINKAEEILMAKGQWVGTTEEFQLDVVEDGLIYVPSEVESVLGATYNGMPVGVQDRFLDFNENGAGYQYIDPNGTNTNRHGFPMLIARGERLVNGNYQRVYYVSGRCDAGCLRILCKLKHRYKLNGAEQLNIRCYPALRAMVQSLYASNAPTAKPTDKVANLDAAKRLEMDAVQFLNDQLKEYGKAERKRPVVQMAGFAPGLIYRGI